jgi:endogenous inhibitor of DNA gyrase (YacG/DUF329 family)
MNERELKLNCPTCGKQVDASQPAANPYFPFCCKRCKLIDLGKWLDEEHRISEPLPNTGNDKKKEHK